MTWQDDAFQEYMTELMPQVEARLQQSRNAMGPGWVRYMQSYTLPTDDDLEDIINVAKTHSRCRVTVETWERR